LVISSIENTIRMEVLMSLKQELHRTIPAQALKDQDIRRMFEHVDRIASIAAKAVRPRYEAQEQRVKDIFFAPGHFSDYVNPNLADKNVQNYLVDAMEEVLQADTITSYLIQFGPIDFKTLFPLGEADTKRYGEEEKSARGYGLGEGFLRKRMMLMLVLDIPVMQNRLPNGDKFQKLKTLSLRNAEIARKNRLRALSMDGARIERAEIFTSQALWSQDAKILMTDDIKNKMKEEVRLLASRINMLKALNLSEEEHKSRCAALATSGGVDLKSVEGGKGDWTKIRLADGKGIAQGSEAHTTLAWLIEWGCAGPRDFKTARKVLEDIAVIQNPITKHSTECKLAHWLRYGIGGRKDIQRADKLEAAHADRMNGKYKCRSQYPIDPNNPWADLK
jgi:hypothetical protein